MALRRLVVLSEPKKSGKTFMAACLALWWAVTNPHTEIILVANDEEQATARVFKTAVDLIDHNKALDGECEVYTKPDPNAQRHDHDAHIIGLRRPREASHSLCIFDEIWR